MLPSTFLPFMLRVLQNLENGNIRSTTLSYDAAHKHLSMGAFFPPTLLIKCTNVNKETNQERRVLSLSRVRPRDPHG